MKRTQNLDAIVQTLQTLLPQARKVALHEPFFNGNEWAYVKDCLDSGWVSSAGSYVDLFEQQLAEYTGIKHVIALVNGTTALHMVLYLTGISSGDEVLVPALTFVATANAVSYCGAVPHFVDCEEKTLGIDPYKLGDYLKEIADVRRDGCFNKKTGRCLKAVIAMHTFGHPVDLDPLAEECRRFRLELIEDAAEALGSLYKGKHVGSWGRASIISFNGNKIVTTGGGGAVLTNDESLARLTRHLTVQAKLPHRWSFNHDMVGYNYRLPNLNAALGLAQLEQLPDFLQRKRALAMKYHQTFPRDAGVEIFKEPEFATSNYWLNVLLLDKEYAELRDELLEHTHRLGIITRPAWTLMHRLPMYENCPRMDLNISESLERQIINIPSSAFL